MKKMNRRSFLLLVFLVLVIASGFAIYKKIEWVDQEYELAPRAIAFRQNYLAAERLLEQYHYTTETPNYRSTINALPTIQHDTLWLAELNLDMPMRDLDDLFSWIENGGHLVSSVFYEDHIDQEPNLVAKLEEHKIITTPQSVAETIVDFSQSDEYMLAVEAELSDGQRIDVELGNGPYFHTNHHKALKIGPNGVWHGLVSMPIGEGQLTLLNNRQTFSNDYIGNVDNAFLLLTLLKQTNTKSIAIIENTRHTPGLLATLWQKIPLVLSSLGLVLLGWLIYASRRLGPIEIAYDHGRSNLLAHLAARAQFWRKHKNLDTLLKPLRAAAYEKIRPLQDPATKASTTTELSDAELEYAKTLGKCSAADIHTALIQGALSDSQFHTSVSVLRNILNHSTIGPNRV